MARLSKVDKSQYNTLLAADKIDASRGILFKKISADGDITGIAPNTSAATILIGIGGVGVQTLDYIKGKVEKTMLPTWNQYISFLGIDADNNEIKRTSYLSGQDEWIAMEDSALNTKLRGVDVNIPRTWHNLAAPEVMSNLTANMLTPDGSGRLRIMGKLKLHNTAAGNMTGYDKQIINTLHSIKGRLNHTRYEIYVIGSANGGTCSGCFLEMPALIREAMGYDNVNIYGMLFLPDTMSAHPNINYRDEAIANGFATLRELDYHCAMEMRNGCVSLWPYTGNSEPLVMDSNRHFFTVPYLIGTQNGPTKTSLQQAQETIAEFLISILGDYSANEGTNFVHTSALNNVGTRKLERGENVQSYLDTQYNKPKTYGAIGFAECSAPVQIVRSYVVGNACDKAGIKSLPADKWQDESNIRSRSTDGYLVPFRGSDCLEDAVSGTKIATSIVQPLEDALKNIVYGFHADLASHRKQGSNRPAFVFDWENVKKQNLPGKPAFISECDGIVKAQTSVAADAKLQNDLEKAFNAYVRLVQNYVKEHGPRAFVNLYRGKFHQSNGDYGRGIEQMVKNIVHGSTSAGNTWHVESVEDAERDERQALRKINKDVSMIEKGLHLMGIKDNRQALVNEWRDKKQKVINAKINAKRTDVSIGEHKYLYQKFLLPAAMLCDDLEAFAHILDNLADAYTRMGKSVDDPQQFAVSCDNASEVNLASVDTKSYNWIKRQADAQIQNLNAKELRDSLVDSFFANIEAWLAYPDEAVAKQKDGSYKLVNQEVGLPARSMFDSCVSAAVDNTLDVSIASLFRQVCTSDNDYTNLAANIIDKLNAKSAPLFHGQYNRAEVHISIMYPNSLNATGEGIRVIQAINSAAHSQYNPESGMSYQIFGSDDTDTIRIYQFVMPLEMCRLTGLRDWEQVYKTKMAGSRGMFMHGYSPCTELVDESQMKYRDRRPWSEFPTPVAYTSDPKTITNHSNGKIIDEGARQMVIDQTIATARKMGLLYCEKGVLGTEKGYVVKFAKLPAHWAPTCDDIAEGENGYPSGKELMEAIVSAFGGEKSLEEISENVGLLGAGPLSKAAVSEAQAWKNAAQILYAHIPLLNDIEDGIVHFEKFFTEYEKMIREQERMRMPAMFGRMLYAGKVWCKNNVWYFRQSKGQGQQTFLNTEPTRVSLLPPKYQNLLSNNMLYAYVYFRLIESGKITNDQYFNLYDQAVEEYNILSNRVDSESGTDALDELKEWKERVADFEKELVNIPDVLGAEFPVGIAMKRSAASIPANRKFRENMENMGFNKEEAQAFFDFYHKASMWNY